MRYELDYSFIPPAAGLWLSFRDCLYKGLLRYSAGSSESSFLPALADELPLALQNTNTTDL